MKNEERIKAVDKMINFDIYKSNPTAAAFIATLCDTARR